MAKFIVTKTVIERVQYTVEIEADDAEEALRTAELTGSWEWKQSRPVYPDVMFSVADDEDGRRI